MLKLKLKNYEEFKSIFGTRNSARGCIYNKILLSFWMHRFKVDKDGRATSIRNMDDLYKLVEEQLGISDHEKNIILNFGDHKLTFYCIHYITFT